MNLLKRVTYKQLADLNRQLIITLVQTKQQIQIPTLTLGKMKILSQTFHTLENYGQKETQGR